MRPSAWIVLAVLAAGAVARAGEAEGGLPAALRERLQASEDLAASGTRRQASADLSESGERLYARDSLVRFFAERGHRPAWTVTEGALEGLLQSIEGARTHGLEPAHYHLESLRRAIETGDALAIELLATEAYLTLAAHVLGGRLDPVSIEPAWTASRRERDLVRHLEAALAAGQIAGSMVELEPDAPGYAVLKESLGLYRQAAREGGWVPIPAGRALRLGDSGPRVAALRSRLRATGLLAARAPASDGFDLEVESAVAAFQRRIGIEVDGVVGVVTLRELNRRAEDRVAQIRANLERWRWLPQDLGRRHIRVNIADFRLEARHEGRVVRRHDVIVGRSYRKTPVFSGKIAYVVLNPWWDTPDNLARQDKLPAFQKDPKSVARLGFEVLDRAGRKVDPDRISWGDYSPLDFPFRLRQRPGPQNALGQVKLIFPNPHNVYLHDTPSRALFARNERAFSSGCVRVSDAVGLTAWVLEESASWSRERIDATLADARETRIDLRSKLPVHILYFTAVSEPDGSLRLIADVYDRDARLIAALAAAPPGGSPASATRSPAVGAGGRPGKGGAAVSGGAPGEGGDSIGRAEGGVP